MEEPLVFIGSPPQVLLEHGFCNIGAEALFQLLFFNLALYCKCRTLYETQKKHTVDTTNPNSKYNYIKSTVDAVAGLAKAIPIYNAAILH